MKPSSVGSQNSAMAVHPSVRRTGSSQVPSSTRTPARKAQSGKAKAASPNQVCMNRWATRAPTLPSQFSTRTSGLKMALHGRLTRSWSIFQVKR